VIPLLKLQKIASTPRCPRCTRHFVAAYSLGDSCPQETFCPYCGGSYIGDYAGLNQPKGSAVRHFTLEDWARRAAAGEVVQ
jgi:hypothetical protein